MLPQLLGVVVVVVGLGCVVAVAGGGLELVGLDCVGLEGVGLD
ncbi:MAG TPA: hypothetical protein VKI64_07675 [Acidimicrobiales bacterium]|nr:hypothetical protein [Acidimicrobiales bacterium]